MKRALMAAWCVLVFVSSSLAAERIHIGYSSISGAYIGIWVAHDA